MMSRVGKYSGVPKLLFDSRQAETLAGWHCQAEFGNKDIPTSNSRLIPTIFINDGIASNFRTIFLQAQKILSSHGQDAEMENYVRTH
jgi:hypothetical protein